APDNFREATEESGPAAVLTTPAPTVKSPLLGGANLPRIDFPYIKEREPDASRINPSESAPVTNSEPSWPSQIASETRDSQAALEEERRQAEEIEARRKREEFEKQRRKDEEALARKR